ncbi:GerAB/ArcD/ProY family transporter [Paenibacillus nanensis]|uniref:GerAB/ArcD/ProY family transporter n=1 Tax=Paenibacillus nanensis TaxID=393251 RepID=UPI0013C2F697|nr:endospore germination permease [Paenibacillus nanensis]
MQKITSRQIVIIGTIYTLVTTLITVPTQMVYYARQHVGISLIVSAAVVLFGIWMITKVLGRFPKQDLFQALINRYPVGGRITSALYVLFFFYVAVRDLRLVTDFTNVVLLPTTPLGVIAFLVMISAVFLVYGGVEVLGRATEIYGILLLLLLLSIPFVLFGEYDIQFARPFLEFNTPGILIGSWFVLPYLGEIIGIAFMFTNGKLRFKHASLGLLLGTLAMLTLLVQSVLILGIPIMSRMLYPTYELVRQIRVTDFLDRFDLPIVGIWYPAMIAKIGYSIFIVCNGIKRVVPESSGQRLVYPVGLLIFVCSIWFFESSIQLFNLNRVWPMVAVCFLLLIPAVLLVAMRPKELTSGEDHEKGAG